jgi:hypothetical protein
MTVQTFVRPTAVRVRSTRTDGARGNRKSALLIASVCIATLALAGCGGSTGTSPGTTSPQSSGGSTTAPSPGPNGTGDTACQSATVTGSTSNAQLKAMATKVYQSLDCGGSAPLNTQLEAAATGQTLKQEAAAAGVTTKASGAAGGYTLTLTKGDSGCQVLTLNSPPIKSLTCTDL